MKQINEKKDHLILKFYFDSFDKYMRKIKIVTT